MRRFFQSLTVIALLALFQSSAAFGQASVSTRRLGVWWSEGRPHLSFSARDLATPDLKKKLLSGLPQTLFMHIYAYPERSREPVAVSAISCRVAYDLWEEVFRVQLQSDDSDRSTKARTLAEVHEHCLIVRNRPIGRPENYRVLSGRPIYFAVAVEQNPISRDTIERIRRWLSRPSAGSGMGGDAFFGSFVSIFVNRQIGSAERVLQFRSPPHNVP